MPFLSPNQQCQSTEGKNSWPRFKYIHSNNVTLWLLMIMMSTVQQRQHGDTQATGCESWSRKHWDPVVLWENGCIKHQPYELLLLLLLHLFNGLFSRTTWASRHQKGKPFWILLEQEMMGWQWQQMDLMQIICTSLQTDNHTSTSPLFLQARCLSCHPTNSVKSLKADQPYEITN